VHATQVGCNNVDFFGYFTVNHVIDSDTAMQVTYIVTLIGDPGTSCPPALSP